MMAEKILALLVAFLGGVALTALLIIRVMRLGIRYSPASCRKLREALDRADARHAILGNADPVMREIENSGDAVAHDLSGLCQFVIDPLDKPHIDENGNEVWRSCPNPGTVHTVDGGLYCQSCSLARVARYKQVP